GLLLCKLGRAVIPLPGGCVLGARPIDRHLEGLEAMGAAITRTPDGLEILAPHGLHGTSYTFAKKSHTGTEALLLSAVLAKGQTVLSNAGLEPEIDDLITFLNRMGAKVRRVGESIEIMGVKELHGATHRVMSDRNEAVSYACMAVATGGDIIVENACPAHLRTFLTKLKKIGGSYEVSDYGIRFFREQELKALDLTTAPEPGFMTDWQPLWTTMMTQARGTSHIIEAVHNNRLVFTKELNKMGAKIKLYDPGIANPAKTYQFEWPEPVHNFHAAAVTGPTPLRGTHLTVPDLRGGATLVMAAIIAKGDSVIDGVEHIDRGYEHFDTRLRNLSANIERLD
ncbi:UDP-N-acetylglucosamine 1-carboxyvinyltransferase, partial [Patescibacteria group bacterium]|nr:UDP-N-acetylglucosamine 1-carboxyvinyltransferase [Patescibacteria group bacterium]